MPRKVDLTAEQYEELEHYAEHDADENVRRRARVVIAASHGLTHQSIARRLACSTSFIRTWVKAYLDEGGSALALLPVSRRTGTLEAPNAPRTELSAIDPLDMDETAVLRLAKHTFLEANSIEDTDTRVRRKTDVLKLMLSAVEQRKGRKGAFLRTINADIEEDRDADNLNLPSIPKPSDIDA